MKMARTFSGEFWRGLLLVLGLLAFCAFVLSNAKAAEAHEVRHAQRQHRHYHHVHHTRHHHRVSHRRWRVKDARRYRAIFEEWDSAPRSNILADARRYLGMGNVTGFRGPWCMAFVQKILHETGHHFTRSLRAIDARLLGPRTYPHAGAIAYTSHHTGFVVAAERGRVLLLSGNHSHRVGIGWYSEAGMHFVEPR
jgi:hypothetical protein